MDLSSEKVHSPVLAKLKILINIDEDQGWDVAQLVKASDRHAADAGSIPRRGKGFSSQSQLSVQTLFRCPYTHVRNCMH